jgi:hypothetical protein
MRYLLSLLLAVLFSGCHEQADHSGPLVKQPAPRRMTSSVVYQSGQAPEVKAHP